MCNAQGYYPVLVSSSPGEYNPKLENKSEQGSPVGCGWAGEKWKRRVFFLSIWPSAQQGLFRATAGMGRLTKPGNCAGWHVLGSHLL